MQLRASRPFFTPQKTCMRMMNLDHADSGHFVLTWERRSSSRPGRIESGYARLGETFFASSIIGHWQ